MKIRNGFVTNSSSTSFIISTKDNWKKETFMKSIGADGGSPLNKVFEDLYDAVEANKMEISKAARNFYEKETIKLVRRLLDEGRTVYYGKLYSDGDSPSEIYFCCQSFIVCDDDIYFNGVIGGW